ncbi:MAG: FAD-dependent oxidoreductase [Thermomicrobiales bacterium]
MAARDTNRISVLAPQAASGKTAARESMVSRRTLLTSATGLALPAFLRQPVGAAGERVIVIGAGIAGIAAARDLQNAGLAPVILEARDRIGGRIWTNRRWGFPLDMGASWIHGAAALNPMWRLRNQYNLRTTLTDWDDIALYDVNGNPVTSSQQRTDAARYRSAYRKARRWGNRQDHDTSLQDGFDFATRPRAMTPYDQRALNFRINFEVEQDYGGDADDLSNWWFDQDEWLGGRQDAYLIDGYGPLVETLADGLDIQLNTVVQAVSVTSSGVRVTTSTGQQQAPYAVMTVPLGVLKQGAITFSPALSRAKQNAIRRLGVGTLNKLYLGFAERFWDDTTAIGYQSSQRGKWSLWMDLERLIGEPVLVAYNAATYGREVEALSDQQTIDAALTVLRAMYGRSAPAPQAAIITRWNDDPYALGSYSFIPVGASGAQYRALGAPTGNRLFWAGEATNRRYPQTVAGAYLSGQLAARLILALV